MFTPLYQNGNLVDSVSIPSIGTTPTPPSNLPATKGAFQYALRVCNTSGVWVFINLGNSSMTPASAAKGLGVPPNDYIDIIRQADATHISAVAAATGGALQITAGQG